MGEVVLIYGKSGSGKSRSLKNFAEDEERTETLVKKETGTEGTTTQTFTFSETEYFHL